jgi:hypothetical protein
MSDSDEMNALVAALGATIPEEGATVAAAPAQAHDYPEELLTSSDDEATGPMKKRKNKGRCLTRRKKTTRRVSGEQETPSPTTANNLLENRVDDLEEEVLTRQGKLVLSEDARKQGKETISLLNKQVKVLKEELKALSAEEVAKELGRLKVELSTVFTTN